MKKRENRFFVIIGAIIIILSTSFYLIAYFPGLMSSDSMSQWEQMVTFKLDDWHPVMHTMFNYLITRLWYSPASVVIAQILILTAVFIYGVNVLLKLGVSKVLLSAAIFLAAVYPTNGLLIICLWKDILYSIMLLWMTIILINIFISDGKWLNGRRNIAAFIVNSFGVLFFRHNGIMVFVSAAVVLIIFYKGMRRNVAKLSVIILAIYFIITGPIYSLVGVVKAQSSEAMGIPMQQVAAVIKYNGKINEAQKEFFNKVLPLELWSKNYNAYSTNPLKFNDSFNGDFLMKHKFEFVKHWTAIVINNPQITTEAYLKQTSMVWKVVPYSDSYVYTISSTIDENKFGIKQIKLNDKISNTADKIRKITEKNNNYKIVFWRPALWFYIVVITVILAAVFINYKAVIIMVPILFNSLSLMIATPAQDYRYLYSNFLIATIVLPLGIQSISARKKLEIGNIS